METIKNKFLSFYKINPSWTLTLPRAIILAAIMLSLSHIVYGFIVRQEGATKQNSYFAGRVIDDTDLPTGDTKSNVFVVEYSDTECPFCASLQPTIKQLKEEYSSKVGFVYRYFPLTQIHPNAFEEARAVFCVGKLRGAEKREEFINEIFSYKTSKQNMTLPPNGKIDLAKNIGVDEVALNECLAESSSADIISASLEDGIKAGVEGTPSTFVLAKTRKGYEIIAAISGAQSYSYFKAAIDEALSRN